MWVARSARGSAVLRIAGSKAAGTTGRNGARSLVLRVQFVGNARHRIVYADLLHRRLLPGPGDFPFGADAALAIAIDGGLHLVLDGVAARQHLLFGAHFHSGIRSASHGASHFRAAWPHGTRPEPHPGPSGAVRRLRHYRSGRT